MKKIMLLAVLGTLVLAGNMQAAEQSLLTTSATQEKKVENREEKISRLANQLTVKTISLLTNIKQLMTRVENRIVVMEKAGKEVSAAKAKLPTAKAAIAGAEETIKTLSDKLSKIATVTAGPINRKEIRASYQGLLEQTKTEIKKARQAVVDVIELLKK